MVCPGYADYRENKNLDDDRHQVRYFQQVINQRLETDDIWYVKTCPCQGAAGRCGEDRHHIATVYNLQQKFEQNLHLQINPKIYNLQFRQNASEYLKNQRNTFKFDSIELWGGLHEFKWKIP
jgi:hypothetical protein